MFLYNIVRGCRETVLFTVSCFLLLFAMKSCKKQEQGHLQVIFLSICFVVSDKNSIFAVA